MNLLGVVSDVTTLAGGRVVATVGVDQLAVGYEVGPCEVPDHIANLQLGDRVLVVPIGDGTAQYVIAARYRLPDLT